MAILELSSFEMIEKVDVPGQYQCVLDFDDNVQLSIVSGKGAYSRESAPYEIAVIKHGNLTHMPGITDVNFAVKGHLTEADVSAIIKKMYLITGKSPIQI